MDMFSNLSLGFSVALSFQNLALCFVGCLVGTLIGVLPGVGPIATISILLPITFGPVSYTHLDVYKRQDPNYSNSIINKYKKCQET